MKWRFLACALVLPAMGLFAGCSSSGSSPSPGTAALFVTTQGDSLVSAFAVDLSTGKLSTNGTGVATGSLPSAMILSPDGNTLFVANSGSNDISAYTVNPDGTLSAAGSGTAGGVGPIGLAIDSGGKFLFVANQGSSSHLDSSTVSVFSISGTGLSPVVTVPLTHVPNSTTNTGAVAVAVTQDGKFLYVANQFENTVAAYSVDAAGMPTELTASPYTVGTAPSGLTIAHSQNGDFLYVANAGSSNVAAFSICANSLPNCTTPSGELTAVTGSPFSAGLGPGSMTVDPTGAYLYVADKQSNQISQYKMSTGTGVLTANSPATVSTGANPASVAAHTGETKSNTTTDYVYVPNLGSASISIFSFDTTSGALAVVGSPVTTGGQPSAIVVK